MPVGIMKDRSSPVIPQDALFTWKMMTQVMMIPSQTNVPTIDLITSGKGKHKKNNVKNKNKKTHGQEDKINTDTQSGQQE